MGRRCGGGGTKGGRRVTKGRTVRRMRDRKGKEEGREGRGGRRTQGRGEIKGEKKGGAEEKRRD